MISIKEGNVSLIYPKITLFFKDSNQNKSQKLICIIFYQDKNHRLFEIAPGKYDIDLNGDLEILKQIDFIVISVINNSGTEYFTREIPVDKNKRQIIYNKFY